MKKEEHFNTSKKRKPAQRQPMQLGLYDAANEHDEVGDELDQVVLVNDAAAEVGAERQSEDDDERYDGRG